MRWALVLAAVAGLAGAAPRAPSVLPPGWREIAWPFPRDAWPAGRAFRCDGAGCGGGLDVYVRPKLGFCNCTTGVTEDSEVDAVADLDMIRPDFIPAADGAPVRIAGIKGRARSYTMADGQPASGYALSTGCDLLVAASLGPAARSGVERVRALLEAPGVAPWIARTLGRADPGAAG